MERVKTTGPETTGSPQDILLREPTAEDGMAVNQLIAACPPLDRNSVYCNLLQCSHFSETCVVAEAGNELVGFASAYLHPRQPHTIFIWQIAVGEKARGRGLAKKMLLEILQRPVCREVNSLETTINPDNAASWKLFENLANDLGAVSASDRVLFEQDLHFHGQHPEERLLRIYSDSGSLISGLASTAS